MAQTMKSDGIQSTRGRLRPPLSHLQANKVGQGGMGAAAYGFWPGLSFIPLTGRAHTRPLGSGQVKEWGQDGKNG
ncbi:hypothetical protein SISNIDRAFT_460024, partial [Sistotremastrum niveocremeum HHB9708]